ncbi:MAG: glycine--tRNA ligase [Nanoarchaeota archaeon]
MVTIEELTKFCKEKGYVYQTGEIYGGLAGFFDLGHNGVELNNNIKQEWWKRFVQSRDDIFGIDGSIITHPKVWEASGHVDNFMDLMITCSKCKTKIRADHFIEDKLDIPADGLKAEEINDLVENSNLKCPECQGDFQKTDDFNLMFTTNVGPKVAKENTAFLRPETAQLIFANFKLVVEHSRAKLPFGIAQIGKAFRNEISPRDFVFRAREFEQMEIEYFINPKEVNNCPWVEQAYDFEFNILSAEMQEKKIEKTWKITGKKALEEGIIKTQWHVYWLYHALKYYIDLGADPENFRLRQHLETEKSHYALDTWDVDYKFPFGWKELTGAANRTDYDLNQHIKHSKKDLSIFDEESKEKVVPYVVAEPSFGVGRSFLVFMLEAYNDDKERGNKVLKLHPKLAPVKVGVFPLVNKLNQEAKEIHNELKTHYTTKFDKGGSIGRRYARADEEGIPYCITYDFDSKDDETVTIRDRDSTQQKRVKISEVKELLGKLINEEKKFSEL